MSKTDEQEEGLNCSRLERQVERGNYFIHSEFTRQAERVNESDSFLYALIDVLLEKGVFQEEELKTRVLETRREILDKLEQHRTGVALRKDGARQRVPSPVNCQERLHICKAACCKLNFALSREELENGVVKWDLGRPYFIRQEKDGYCTHQLRKDHECGIYQDRPGPCKSYSCANDARIWTDFDNMVLNTEWIEASLGESKMKFATVYMDAESQEG